MAEEDVILDSEVDKSTMSVLKLTREYRKEALDARGERIDKNRFNRAVAESRLDLSNKIEGQSNETLPKLANSIEQFSAFIRRALTQFGDWFSVDTPEAVGVSSDTIQKIIECHLDGLPDSKGGRETQQFAQRLGDSVKSALTDSLMIFKVTGTWARKKSFPGKGKGTKVWKLRIDAIRFEDYYFDPTGKGLYEIHKVEKDLHEVVALSEGDNAIYDPEVIEMIKEDHRMDEDEQKERDRVRRGEDNKPGFRKSIVIEECWGTVLDENGKIIMENAVWAIANDKYVIRKPEPNGFWHGESPFVVIPVLRVPFSTYHKALADEASHLNMAYNDLFNLLLDGGIASVWGIKTIRTDWLEDPEEIADGIPQGKTLQVNSMAPPGVPVMEQIKGGEVPRDAMAMLGALQDDFNEAMFANDIRLGQLPSKKVLATEIVEAQQSSNAVLDSISSDIEDGLEKVLTKAWWVIIQNMDNLEVSRFVDVVPMEEMILMARMPNKERFALLGQSCGFKVRGLSSTLSRVRDMQKLLTIIQVTGGNPILNLLFWQQNSGKKIIRHLFKQLNIDPSDFEVDEDDQQQAQVVQGFMAQGGGGPEGGSQGGAKAKSTGPEPEL